MKSDAPAETLIEVRRGFYAGAEAALEEAANASDPRVIEEIAEELKQFAARVKDGVA